MYTWWIFGDVWYCLYCELLKNNSNTYPMLFVIRSFWKESSESDEKNSTWKTTPPCVDITAPNCNMINRTICNVHTTHQFVWVVRGIDVMFGMVWMGWREATSAGCTWWCCCCVTMGHFSVVMVISMKSIVVQFVRGLVLILYKKYNKWWKSATNTHLLLSFAASDVGALHIHPGR